MLNKSPWLVEHQQLLSRQFSSNTLPHAILITGVTGAGKLQLGQWLINLLACQRPINNSEGFLQACKQCKTCLLQSSNTLPDHLNVVAEKTSLAVDEIRFANQFLQKTAQISNYKTVLINKAETMTESSGNALLKTLEEPTDNTVIVLLSNDLPRLLPTIVSRSRVIAIRPLVGQSLMSNVSSQLDDSDKDSNENFINVTHLPELIDESIKDDFDLFKTTYLNYLSSQQEEQKLMHQLSTFEHAFRWLEQITVNLQRQQLIEQQSLNSNSLQLNQQVFHQVYQAILKGCKVLKSYTQANKQFVSEQVIMAIGDILETNKTDIKESK